MQDDTDPPVSDDVSIDAGDPISADSGDDAGGDAGDSTRQDLRDLGPQPIAQIMEARGLKPKDLVGASTEQLSHKMVQRACKGRRLSSHVMAKVRNALNAAADADFALSDLFNYRSSRPRD